ncbi:Os08g0280200 [Oryza sativa Japonica Group]|jgi:hypothetical protein|uniref:Os08g0280200 protein n=2 Tax=Oryza sativa subsp. japonica TaxID=39947 RepID=B9G024_ORYSJ|nr:hypothetical protein OsJ_26725 [Oryza sativa Japonica Group]BAT04700.1 Os08g0280200 [Oryza sativa Japonica Group]
MRECGGCTGPLIFGGPHLRVGNMPGLLWCYRASERAAPLIGHATAVQPQRRATVRQACRLGAGRGWLCGLSLFIISSPSTPPSCLVISYRLWHGHLLIAFSFHFFCEAVCFLWLQLHIVRACQSIRPS